MAWIAGPFLPLLVKRSLSQALFVFLLLVAAMAPGPIKVDGSAMTASPKAGTSVVVAGGPPTAPVSKWRHSPVFVRAGKSTTVIGSSTGYNEEEGLPLGVPIEFESPVFIGKILIRLKPIPSDKHHEAYFGGRKRHYQCIVQGKFKEEGLKFSDVFFGDVYEKPFKGVPTGFLGRALKRFMERLSPGMIYDIASDKPRVLNPIGTVQEVSVDEPGDEPDITGWNSMKENTKLLKQQGSSLSTKSVEKGQDIFESPFHRRKIFSKPEVGSQYGFDTNKVYTFHIYDHTADIGSYQQDLGVIKIDLSPSLNGQPLSLSAITKDDRYLFRFEIWHEKIVSLST